MKKALVAVVVLGVVGIVGTLVVLLFDASISLDHARQQNRFLTEQCQLLVKIANAGWTTQELAALTAKLGPGVTLKHEGKEVRLDDTVVLTLDGPLIAAITSETCN